MDGDLSCSVADDSLAYLQQTQQYQHTNRLAFIFKHFIRDHPWPTFTPDDSLITQQDLLLIPYGNIIESLQKLIETDAMTVYNQRPQELPNNWKPYFTQAWHQNYRQQPLHCQQPHLVNEYKTNLETALNPLLQRHLTEFTHYVRAYRQLIQLLTLRAKLYIRILQPLPNKTTSSCCPRLSCCSTASSFIQPLQQHSQDNFQAAMKNEREANKAIHSLEKLHSRLPKLSAKTRLQARSLCEKNLDHVLDENDPSIESNKLKT